MLKLNMYMKIILKIFKNVFKINPTSKNLAMIMTMVVMRVKHSRSSAIVEKTNGMFKREESYLDTLPLLTSRNISQAVFDHELRRKKSPIL